MLSRLAGAYASRAAGGGVEFAGLVPYTPGQDARRIDWAATARSGRAFVRLRPTERSARVLVVADVSASMHLPPGAPAAQRAMEAGHALALVALAYGDAVGAVTFDGRHVATVPPGRRRSRAVRIARALARAPHDRSRAQRTDPRPALRALLRARPALALLLTDAAWEPGPGAGEVGRLLAACACRHDLRALLFDVGTARHGPGVFTRVMEAESGREAWLRPQAGPGASLARARRGVAEAFVRACVLSAPVGVQDNAVARAALLVASEPVSAVRGV